MRRKCLLLLIAIFSQLAFGARTESINISPRVTKAKPGCEDYLTKTLRGALNSLDKSASVHLGFYHELEILFVKAGVDLALAKETVETLIDLHSLTYRYPPLRFPSEILTELIKSKQIFVCVIGSDCRLARADQNFMLFTEQHETILLMPPPREGAIQFAVNFFGSIATVSGERILLGWLKAGFTAEQHKPGSAGDLYYEYASHYDGNFPPNPGSIQQGFTLTFMTLYSAAITNEMYTLINPGLAANNAKHLAKRIYRDLTQGRNSQITRPVVERLGITEINFFNKASELLNLLASELGR